MTSPAADNEPTISASFNAFQENFTTIALVFLLQLALLLLQFLLIFVPLASRLIAALNPDTFAQLFDSADSLAAWLAATLNPASLGDRYLLAYWSLVIISSMLSVFYVAIPALYYARGQTITPAVLCNEVKKRPWRYWIAAIPIGLISLDWPMLGRWPILLVFPLLQPLFTNLMVTTNCSVADAAKDTLYKMFKTRRGRSFLVINILSSLVVLASALMTCGFGLLLAAPTRDFYLQNLLSYKRLRS